MKKKVAVIGAGFSGIGTIVALKEEGIELICFEKTDKAGGTWYYREDSEIGLPSVMPTTVTIHSKEIGTLSNFPPDKKYNNYLRHTELYEVFLDYCEKFDALRHVQYNTEVVDVKRSSDYDETGCWIVSTKIILTGKVTSGTYESVIVCVGNMSIPKWPSPYPGQNTFKGKIIHTHYLKKVTPYDSKKVVIVGMGCGGLDAASQISNVAKQVYLSTRSGAHVMSRVGPNGHPIDNVLLRRYLTTWFNIIPQNIISWVVENFYIKPRFSPRLYAVKPKYHFLSKDPVVNDDIANKLLCGSVIQKRDIIKFVENGVIFDGESDVTEADIVIMATGYTVDFPFLEKDIRIGDHDKLYLYKNIWPPYMKHPTLAFAGFVLPNGPGFPVGEMQSRYIAFIMSGKGKLPSSKEMLKDIEKQIRRNFKRYVLDRKQSIRVDFVQYQDELASIIGVKPNFLKIFFTDPKLYYKLIFGPSLPYQYRLTGPHSWSGARQAIMTSEKRTIWPLVKEYTID